MQFHAMRSTAILMTDAKHENDEVHDGRVGSGHVRAILFYNIRSSVDYICIQLKNINFIICYPINVIFVTQ